MPHDLLFEKVKKLPINPYVVNWIISFLGNRRQRVVVDGIVTEYLNIINRGICQGIVIGPILFSIMVDDIKTVDSKNELVKFADNLTWEFLVMKVEIHFELNSITYKLGMKKTECPSM